MKARNHPRLARLLAAALAAAPLAACASAPRAEDPDRDLKRARSHYDLAVERMSNGEVEWALRELLAAERLDPENPRIQHGLGAAYLAKGKLAEAEKHFRRALEIWPQDHDARFNLSTLYLNQGRYRDSIRHARILHDDPTYASPWRALTNWGWALYRLGQPEEALERLERSREYNGRYWPTLLNLGIIEAERGRRVEAIGHFSKVLELSPGPSAEAEASYRLGQIYVAMGQRKEAVDYLRMAVVKAPSGPWGQKSEEYLKLLR